MKMLQIAVLVVPTYAYFRSVLRGIARYARTRAWDIAIRPNDVACARSLKKAEVDGILADLDTLDMAKVVRGLGIPVVNVSNTHPRLGVPRVGPDEGAVGAQAAEHLFERGLRKFGFCEIRGRAFSQERFGGFAGALKKRGCDVIPSPSLPQKTPHAQVRRVRRSWLAKLPKPIGLLCASDALAFEVSEDCRAVGLRIPDDVALVGVDDDDLFCSLMSPPISSVSVPSERIGFEAAGLLDRLIKQRSLSQQEILLQPGGVSVRQSSDLLAMRDPDVVHALRLIRSQALQTLRIDEIVEHLDVSRTTLERRFQQYVGRTILEEVWRVRMEAAKYLLHHTVLPVSVIAQRVGCTNQAWFAAAFRREAGLTPTAYRRSFQTSAAGGR